MIQVNLFRVSVNQEYLEFILDCPQDYRFNKLLIRQYDYVPVNSEDSVWKDYSNIFNPSTDSTRIIARINLKSPSCPFTAATIFYATIGVTYVGTEEDYEEIEDVSVACSNTAWVYQYNLNRLMSIDPYTITDVEYKSITRNYIYTQAHMEAMRLERFDEAERFYTLLKKVYNE